MNQIAQYLAKGGASCKTEPQHRELEYPAVSSERDGGMRKELVQESERPAIWEAVRQEWSRPAFRVEGVGRPRCSAGRIAEILGLGGHWAAKRVRNNHLDRPQQQEAFWANYSRMMKRQGS